MSIKKKVCFVALAVLFILVNVWILGHDAAKNANLTLNITISSDVTGDIQAFYSTNGVFSDSNSSVQHYTEAQKEATLSFTMPSDSSAVRLDFGDREGTFTISRIWYSYQDQTEEADLSAFTDGNAVKTNDIGKASLQDGKLVIVSTGNDPYLSANSAPASLQSLIAGKLERTNLFKNILYAVLFDGACLLLFIFRKRFSTLPRELIANRRLILKLAKNDFKTKYAGSVLGITWAFVQPVITILVYWFVFGLLGSGDVTASTGITYPFVLWLVCGLVPWFFFSDTLISGTNALIEYAYLVKKVVFKISILPIIKEISALFVHLFFIVLMMVIFCVAGHFPDVYSLQVVYYSFCLFIYSLGVCYATCAIVIFFRDLSQIISIIIQVQVWMTPIMWNMEAMSDRIPGWALVILKLNPIYYIVNGYRDAMMNKVWFFERFDLTIYFWLITAVFFALGTFIFKRLKVHFADIL